MVETKWVMNRAGLLNFWYYDDEIFNFSNGKLLLRGTNGSGKSVTMQSFLPVLLDGKKTPDRLDPFGSKARKMEDYLLGEKEVVNRDERTGYLFIEYKKWGTDQYITTGIGMQARRNKGIKSWYFLITDQRRIGYDFQLTETYMGESVPLSAKQLENRISGGGHLVHTQREYMELVNKSIFGFQSIDAYEDLIKLLIQLRSPKLSKDFKPTVIYEILESALPPLTDDELRHLSDTIENMDQTQQQLEQLEREYKSSSQLVKQYDIYNQFILAERAKQWDSSLKREKSAKDKVQRLQREIKSLENEITTLEVDRENFEQKKRIAENEKERLQNHEVWNLQKELTDKKEQEKSLEQQILSLENKADGKSKSYHNDLLERENVKERLQKHEKDIHDILDELEVDAEESAFSLHMDHVSYFHRHIEDDVNFTVWRNEANDQEQTLLALKKLIEEEERLTEKHLDLQRQSAEKKQTIDQLKQEQEHLEQWFIKEKQKLTDQVFIWIEQHSDLQFSKDQLQEITRSLEGLYEINRYDDVRDPLILEINEYIARLKTEISMTEKFIEEKDKEIVENEDELKYWKTLKMPQPERSKGTEAFRKTLADKEEAYVPFYAAVEFLDHVTDEQKERLESALKKTGLLDSLITNQVIEPKHDQIIRTQPLVLTPTLADYLRPDLDPDSPITEQLVDEVLRSIPLEQDGAGLHIDADGTYSVGCLVGHAPDEGPSKYIGRASRKKFQQEKIIEYELILEKLQLEQREYNILLNQLEEQVKQADQWKKIIPDDNSLFDINNEMLTTMMKIKHEQEVLLNIDQEWKQVLSDIQRIKIDIHDKGKEMNLSLSLESVEQALSAIKSYIDYLHQLEKTFQSFSYSKRELKSLCDRIEEKEIELDEIKGELNVKRSELSQTKTEQHLIEEQLKLKGIDEIRQRIQEVLSALNEANEGINYVRDTLPIRRENRNTRIKELEIEQKSAEFWTNMTMEWEKMVKGEIALQFIEVEEEEATSILSKFKDLLEKYDRQRLTVQLNKVFMEEQSQLTEYRMFQLPEDAEIPSWFSSEWGDSFEPFINEWHMLRGRQIIQMEYQGQQVSPYFVLSSLEKELEQQKNWLDEQDRQLYEDIIVNTVGVILRNRIQRAQKWVQEMDQIMKNRDNSSGLTFSITWKPLTAESEQELDTKDLVSLLQRNSKFLNEEDLNRITKHFQSRIEKAKELIQLRNEGSTLHQVLKEVLDYRKWFTFILSYKRVNEPRRELTNNAFFKFSGGEKAMAMYIPLFTAAYSRYKEAGEMAPYIITLDEAFAGVDENNIRDMFEVVEQLGFDYIMNSQALWGDYDTISSLSICELVRPKNADYVTVIRYEWDGKQRSYVFDEKQQGEPVVND